MSSTFLRPLTIALLLTLPLSTLAAPMKGITKPARLDYYTKYSSSSSKKSSSSSSAPYLNTIRSKDLEAVFKIPETWEATYTPNEVSFTLDHKIAPIHDTSVIFIHRYPINQKESLTLAYRRFMENTKFDDAGIKLGGPDRYIPSFHLSGSGTVKVAGLDALSVSYTGESHSIKYAFRRISMIKGKWLYIIGVASLPQYAKEDSKVFDGVVGSFTWEVNKK